MAQRILWRGKDKGKGGGRASRRPSSGSSSSLSLSLDAPQRILASQPGASNCCGCTPSLSSLPLLPAAALRSLERVYSRCKQLSRPRSLSKSPQFFPSSIFFPPDHTLQCPFSLTATRERSSALLPYNPFLAQGALLGGRLRRYFRNKGQAELAGSSGKMRSDVYGCKSSGGGGNKLAEALKTLGARVHHTYKTGPTPVPYVVGVLEKPARNMIPNAGRERANGGHRQGCPTFGQQKQ